MAIARIPPAEAIAFVQGLADLSKQAKTVKARERAARIAATKRTGMVGMSLSLPSEVDRRLKHIMKATGYNRQMALSMAIDAGVAQVDLEGRLSPEAMASMQWLEAVTGANRHQLIDFAVRYMARQLARKKRLSVA